MGTAMKDEDDMDLDEVTPDDKWKVDWKTPPKLADLKLDYQEANMVHEAQCSKIDEWLDNMHVRGTISKYRGFVQYHSCYLGG